MHFKQVEIDMVKIREWTVDDAETLAELLNDKRILDNLRDGLPLSIMTRLSAVSAFSDKATFISERQNLAIISARNTGAKA